MTDLSMLQHQLNQPDLAPVDSWNPPFCGDIPLHIDARGQWFYQQSLIQRPALVKLFASVLICQQGEHFLQTPVEKVRISVADAPLVITSWQWTDTATGPALLLSTNMQHQLVLGAQYPMIVRHDPQQQLLPYVRLWHGLYAKLNRNVYYQLSEQAKPVYCNGQQHFQLKSAGFPYTFAIV